jgi:hypothetical protein
MGSRDSLFKDGNDQQMKQIDNRLVGINQRRSEFSLDWVNNAVIRFAHPFIFLLLGWKSLGSSSSRMGMIKKLSSQITA